MEELKHAGIAWLIMVIIVIGLFIFSVWESRRATYYHKKRNKKNKK